MNIYVSCSRSHKVLLDNFFIPSLPKDLNLIIDRQPQICDVACFGNDKWIEVMRKRIAFLHQAIRDNIGKIFIFSDCDVQFFGPIAEEVSKDISEFDLAFQNEDDAYCTGFFACRGSQNVLDFFEHVYREMNSHENDQKIVNKLTPQYPHLKIKKLNPRFWTCKDEKSNAPVDILIHHVNYVKGIDGKINALDKIKNQIEKIKKRDISQLPLVCCSSKGEAVGSSKDLFGVNYLFNMLELEVDWMVDIEYKSKLSESFSPEQRIWVHIEPQPYTKYFDGFEDYYKGGIFSWHPKIQHLPQFKKYIFGIKGVSPNFSTNRKFGVSGVIGPKCFEWSFNLEKQGHVMDGYRLRRAIIEKQNEINIPSIVYNCKKSWKGQSHDYPIRTKTPSLEHMFHFAIENCFERNYFTEKITDCFLTCCVPIYFGDSEAVSEYFNMNGVIVVSEGNWLEKINNLTEKDYFDRIPAIEDNLSRALMFLHNTKDIYKNTSKILLRYY